MSIFQAEVSPFETALSYEHVTHLHPCSVFASESFFLLHANAYSRKEAVKSSRSEMNAYREKRSWVYRTRMVRKANGISPLASDGEIDEEVDEQVDEEGLQQG